MNILLAYCSPNKTTEKLSYVLRDCFSDQGHTVTLLNMAAPHAEESAALSKTDVMGIGSPVYQLRLASPARRFLTEALPRLNSSAKAFVYLTYGGISSGRAFENTLSLLASHHIGTAGGLKICAPHSFSQQPFPNDDVRHIAADFCGRLHANGFKPIPYSTARQLFACRSTKVKLVYPFADFVGKRRHLPIRIDPALCISCGRCARECPAQAILLDGKAVRNAANCIACYRCAVVCPVKAVICPLEKLENMVRFNKKLLGCEQPQNAILMNQ